MSNNKQEGVVDSDCKAHDLKNLYIIGPSVFPEASYANPMLTIVLLSVRLGNYVAKKVASLHED